MTTQPDLPPNRVTSGVESVTHPVSLGTIGTAIIAGAAFLGQAHPHSGLDWTLAGVGTLAAILAVISPKASIS
jgi:hypothetical protein